MSNFFIAAAHRRHCHLYPDGDAGSHYPQQTSRGAVPVSCPAQYSRDRHLPWRIG